MDLCPAGRRHPEAHRDKTSAALPRHRRPVPDVFDLRAPVAEYLCRNWNVQKTAEKQIAEFEFIYCMESKTKAANTATPQILREQLVHLDLSGL